ncbi:septal ring lytic transglycosylase RlpA family protein [Nibribacter koreensis]|uniref:Probable endolytic peptidoglycan transglycosylase RlpA n=1 Tax=Nibribacter koreensis TaxID=1084519 RepID=A0ABP8FAI2_9BACT
MLRNILFLLLVLSPFLGLGTKPYKQLGKATYYASKYEGRKTSSGEKYDPSLPTAAHAYLPLNTYVKVENLSTGHVVVVKINDRMSKKSPFVIDLSKSAAQELNILGPGSKQVRITGITKEAALAYWQEEQDKHEQNRS